MPVLPVKHETQWGIITPLRGGYQLVDEVGGSDSQHGLVQRAVQWGESTGCSPAANEGRDSGSRDPGGPIIVRVWLGSYKSRDYEQWGKPSTSFSLFSFSDQILRTHEVVDRKQPILRKTTWH